MIERRRDPRRKPNPVKGQVATATIEPVFTDQFGRGLPPRARAKQTLGAGRGDPDPGGAA